MQVLLSHRVDGIVLAPSAFPEAAYAQLARRKVPLVLIDRVPEHRLPRVDAMGVRNIEPVARLVEHLGVAHGHTRIAMLAPKPGIITTEERVAGFRLGLERIVLDPSEARVEYAGESPEQTTAALAKVLELPSSPTALVLGNNLVTVATIAALRERGITPPHGMATVSFDDFPWANSFEPRLTTMSQPVEESGQWLPDSSASASRRPTSRRAACASSQHSSYANPVAAHAVRAFSGSRRLALGR
jgi:LacI family transcriptional regulator